MAFFTSVSATAAGLLALVIVKRWTTRRKLNLPPGPQPLPLIGNVLDLPWEKEWLTYRAWNEEYGDVVCIDALGQKIVILGSATAVDDLMEKRGAIYSDRPATTMLDLIKAQWAFVMLPYGDLWRRKRKLMHAHVHPGVVDRYLPIQTASARRLARDVLAATSEEKALPQAIRLNFAQMIMKVVYGLEIESYESEYISLPERVLEILSEVTTPGRFFVDFLPFLRYIPSWFPGAGFQRLALESQETHRRALDNPINAVQSQMAQGSAPASIARTMLEEDAALPSERSNLEMIKDVAGVAYFAGSDTTVAAVIGFFLGMLVHPEVQARAQTEVDRVVGRDRLPVLEDREELPYVDAIVNECLRWLPVTPMGVPHQSTQDDEYNGYLIPKGTIVMGSIWGLLHNDKDYPQPERFNPERYLNSDGQLDPSVRDPRMACFGFGRRICPGRHIADVSLFMTVVTLLSAVDIVRAKDGEGKEIIPAVEVTSGTLSHPKPFPWAVRPRSRHSEALLASAPV